MASELKIPIDLPDVDVLSSELTSDGKVIIRVESQLESTTCGLCGSVIRCNEGHGQEVKLRHLPVLGRETHIVYRPKRGKCKACWTEPKTTQVVTWHEARSPHTKPMMSIC